MRCPSCHTFALGTSSEEGDNLSSCIYGQTSHFLGSHVRYSGFWRANNKSWCPGTSFQFSISLVDQPFGESVAKEIGDLPLMNTADDISKKEEFNEVQWSLDHTPKVLIPIANGFEEIEVVTIVDILRRAKANVMIALVEKSLQILASRGTKIVADKLLHTAAETIYDLIIYPGGIAGSERLQKSKVLKKLKNKK